MGASPRALAAFAKTHLEVLEECAEPLAARVRATAPAALAAIEKSSRISWIALEHHVALTERLFAEGGRDAGREICRLTVLRSFDQPFLRPLFAGAMAVMGPSFEQFVAWTPRAWPALFRGVGDLAWVAEGPGAGRLVLEPAAPAIVASPDYVEGIAGAFSALFAVTRCEGEIRASASGRRVEFSLHWHRSGVGAG